MSDDRDCFEALDRVSGELRAAEGPTLDWARVESGLFQKIEADEAAGRARVDRVRVRGGIWQALGFAAAAAAVMALGLAAPSAEHASAPRQAAPVEVGALGVPGPNGERDLRALHEGDVIEAKDEPVRFGRDGVVSWTLAPGGRAVVRSVGQAGVGHTLALERGAVRAEVVPRAASEGLVEAFAVEVDGTRVAVHGTAFTVSRVEGGALVDVEHGAVAIGPVGHVGETSGHLLVGPSRALFSLDGGKSARLVARVEPQGTPIPLFAGGAAGEPSAPVAAPASPDADEPIASPQPRVAAAPAGRPAPEEPGPAPAAAPVAPELTRASVETHLARCFHDVYGGLSGETSLSVSSTFRITLQPDGSVKGARFEPPLRPELATCAGGAIAGRFAPGTTDLTIPVRYGK